MSLFNRLDRAEQAAASKLGALVVQRCHRLIGEVWQSLAGLKSDYERAHGEIAPGDLIIHRRIVEPRPAVLP